MSITGVVIGKEHLVPFLRDIPRRLSLELRATVKTLAIKLQRKVKGEKLSGQLLKNRTGNLRRSINYRLIESPNKVTAVVGSNAEYAAAHEYGIDRKVTVREHLRLMTTAWGVKLKEPRQVTVRPHQMHMRLPEKRFLRGSLDEMRPEILERIEATLGKVLKG